MPSVLLVGEPPDPAEKELRAAQRAYESGIRRRREAVGRAYDAGLRPDGKRIWSVYRIAQTLGVKEPTVNAILKAYRREREDGDQPGKR